MPARMPVSPLALLSRSLRSRFLWFPFAVALAVPVSAQAQATQPSAPAARPVRPAAAPNAQLEELLQNWEDKSSSVEDLYCEFDLITLDPVFREKKTEFGKAWALKPYFGRLDLYDENRKRTRIFISTGNKIYQYEAKIKQQIEHILPEAPSADQSVPGPLGLIFNMTARDAKNRFEFSDLQEKTSPEGVTYTQVRIVPLRPEDQQEFKYATLLFDKNKSLPVEMMVVEPNGAQQHWIFSRITLNSKNLRPEAFGPIQVGKDWKSTVNRIPAQPRSSAGDPPRRPSSRPQAGRAPATR